MRYTVNIRYTGFGYRCSHCGKSRETTRYIIHNRGKTLLEYRVCDGCHDRGCEFHFEPPNSRYELDREDRKIRKRRIKHSRLLEEELARQTGGKITPGSGNQAVKGDVRIVGEWRLEHKYTDSVVGYRVLVRDLAMIIKIANRTGEWPAMVITFRKMMRKFAVVPYEVFLNFVEKLRV